MANWIGFCFYSRWVRYLFVCLCTSVRDVNVYHKIVWRKEEKKTHTAPEYIKFLLMFSPFFFCSRFNCFCVLPGYVHFVYKCELCLSLHKMNCCVLHLKFKVFSFLYLLKWICSVFCLDGHVFSVALFLSLCSFPPHLICFVKMKSNISFATAIIFIENITQLLILFFGF